MRVYRVFNSGDLEPERLPVLASVFEELCQSLGLSPTEDGLRDIVAEAVVRCAKKGITDPEEVRKCAEAALREASV